MLVVGHTHADFEVVVEGVGSIVNPAALLRDPVDGEGVPLATGRFGVLELPSRRFTVYQAADGVEVTIVRRQLHPKR